MTYLTLGQLLEERKKGTQLVSEELETKQTIAPTVAVEAEVKEKSKDTLGRAKMLARFANVELNVRDLVDDWILITYDLPATEEGDIARQKFLKQAPKIGAVMHTKSVYLMPNTNACQTEAVELSKIGKVFIWKTQANDKKHARELTDLYDSKVKEMVNDLEDRMNRIRKHLNDKKEGISNRMLDKTLELFDNILFATAQRGDKKLYDKLTDIHNKLTILKADVESAN